MTLSLAARPRAPARWSWLMALVVVLVALGPGRARASSAEGIRHRIELITIDPGDALLSRAGHAALGVVEITPDGRELTTVYNYGDADFDDPWLAVRFAFGQPRFFLSIAGDLYETAERYGQRQNRSVYRQRLALTEAQARAVAERLAFEVQPDHRHYDYHYLHHTCTTEIRRVLDRVLDGAIARQLGARPEPWTIRDYQQLTFDGEVVPTLVSDVIFGRLHDQPIDANVALLWPARMREYVPRVRVPDPAGGEGTVPLAGPPELLAERSGPPVNERPYRLTWWFVPIAALVMVLAAFGLRARSGGEPTRAWGAWLLLWSLPCGVLGAVVFAFSVASTVPELRSNELVVSLPVTDLLLLGPAIGWLRGRTTVAGWVRVYAWGRLGVVATAGLARAVGVFFQDPFVIPLGSLMCGLGLVWLVRGARSTPAASESPGTVMTYKRTTPPSTMPALPDADAVLLQAITVPGD